MSATSKSQPLVLLYSCPSLAPRMRERDMVTSTARSLRQLMHPKEDLEARAIVIGPAASRDLDVADVVPTLRERWPMVDVILWVHKASGSFVRAALQAGARDVVMTSSTDSCAREVSQIVRAQQLLPRAVRLAGRGESSEFEGMLSRSQRMWDLFDTVTQVASTDATVLILGETGTGKELLARAIHRHSRRAGRFVPLNCGAVSESLIASELFGHVRGAFTGATSEKDGLFKHADGGTLFLDEIGNVPLTAQYHLLRALQEGAVRPVGGQEETAVDARVVAATSGALERRVEDGEFREDLFYRLDVIRLEIPPLRDRPEDIIFLFAHFARQVAEEYNVERPDLEDDFLDALVDYEWPGNVRQLQNLTERLVLTAAGLRIDASALRRLLPFRSRGARKPKARVAASVSGEVAIDTSRSLEDNLRPRVSSIERTYLDACLRQCRGRVGVAAERAGVSRRTMLRKLKEHGLDKMDYRHREEVEIDG